MWVPISLYSLGTNNIKMRLQKQSSRGKKDPNYEKYVKWVLVISQDRVNQLGWKEGVELTEETKNDSICIKPLSKQNAERNNCERVLYEEFKMSIKNLLERYPINGLSWTQIRDKLNYSQRVPNNKWVKNLEKDAGLIRIKRGKDMVWRLENDTIYTIGYEGMIIEEFIKKLKNANIQQLIDVREIPLSRKNGFSKTILQEKLKEVGITYKHCSELGSPKRIRHQLHQDWNYEAFFKEYKEIIKDEDVQQKIKDVEKDAKMKKTVLLCFEKDYTKCHRRLIAEELKEQGWMVSHL